VAESQIDAPTLFILNLSDLQKKYAKKMEHLATEIASSRPIPIFGRLFSQNAPDPISENEEITKALRIVSEKTAKRVIRVMDRGGDRGYLYNYLLYKKLKFIIRLRADRTLVADGKASVLRVFGIPNFRLYALADGIKRFLFNPSKVWDSRPRLPNRASSKGSCSIPENKIG
jgi:hypothetical protein